MAVADQRTAGPGEPPTATAYEPAPLQPDADEELLAQVMAEYPHGSRHFTTLMKRHWRFVRSVCQAILLNGDDADDAAQETFIKVHRYLLSFRGESRFTTWLGRIARNSALTSIAQRRNQKRAIDRVAQDPILMGNWFYRRVGEAEDRVLLLKLLNRLNPEDRLLLVMREIEGMSFQDIASILETTEGAARMRAMRARGEFRRLSAGRFGERSS